MGDHTDRDDDLARREAELDRREELLMREEIAAELAAERAASRRGIGPIGIAVGILTAAFVIWFIYSAATANDEVDCSLENVERSLEGLSARDCG